jgi:hypothetical protein
MADVVELVIDSDERAGEGGFLAIRRVHLRNRRADGTLSARYLSDSIARPHGQDAVVVVVYAWPQADRTLQPADPEDVLVLVRDGLRPALRLGRDPDRAPLP